MERRVEEDVACTELPAFIQSLLAVSTHVADRAASQRLAVQTEPTAEAEHANDDVRHRRRR